MFFISGCTVGPKYARPQMSVEGAFYNLYGNSQNANDMNNNDRWWEDFGDPVTTELVRYAIENNYDIKAAAARVLQAEAIFEHHLPRFAGDRLPQSQAGFVVGFADRLDTLIGLFAAGLQPTGAGDPYAMRRAAIGLVQLLITNDLRFDLRYGLKQAAASLPLEAGKDSVEACLRFITNRQQAHLLNEGYRYDVVEAVLAEQGYDPASAAQAVQALEQWVRREDWSETLQAYARCVRITRDETTVHTLDPDRFVEKEERDLYAALQAVEGAERAPGSVDDFVSSFRPMIPAISTFFDEVLVMDEDQNLRTNRLGLLQRIAGLSSGVVDLSKLEGF